MDLPSTGIRVLSRFVLSCTVLVVGLLPFSLNSFADVEMQSFNSFMSDQDGILQFNPYAHFFQVQQEFEVATVTSDAVPGTTSMRFAVDKNFNIVSLRVYIDHVLSQDAPYSAFNLGVLLKRVKNYDVLKIKTDHFNPQTGGSAELIYLEDALSGVNGVFQMEIVRKGNSWVLAHEENNQWIEFSRMFLKANKMFGQTIGIQEIQVN